MAKYVVGITPTIKSLCEKCPNSTQIWFADDSAATSSLSDRYDWWDILTELCPNFGYEVNVNKCWLVVKPHLVDQARTLSSNTGVQISSKGLLTSNFRTEDVC